MAHGSDEPPPGIELKGLSKYFNSWTNSGRANVAKATYAGFFNSFLKQLYYAVYSIKSVAEVQLLK